MPGNPDKIESLLGFALRAGKTVFGYDALAECRRLHLVLYGDGLAENGQKRLIRLAQERRIPLIRCARPIEELVHRPGVKAVGVTDKQMARAMARYANENFTLIAPEVD